jgi:hypothetical protein
MYKNAIIMRMLEEDQKGEYDLEGTKIADFRSSSALS